MRASSRALAFKEHAGLRFCGTRLSAPGASSLPGWTIGRPGIAVAVVPDASVLAGMPPNRFVVLLKRQPYVDSDAVGLFDLRLFRENFPRPARSGLLLGDQGRLRLPPPVFEPSSPRRGAGRLIPLLPGGKGWIVNSGTRNLGAPYPVPHPPSDGYRHRKGIEPQRRASPEMPERPFFSSVRDRAGDRPRRRSPGWIRSSPGRPDAS